VESVFGFSLTLLVETQRFQEDAMQRAMVLSTMTAILFWNLALDLSAQETQRQAGQTGQTPTTPMSDQDFVRFASASGLAEVNLSNLAAKQASRDEVKQFAQHMVEDHTKSNKELINFANQKQLPVATQMDRMHQDLMTSMGRLSGEQFDREYMAGQVRDHEMVVAAFEAKAKDARDTELKTWVTKTLPTLREHLKMAQRIAGTKGTGSSQSEGK